MSKNTYLIEFEDIDFEALANLGYDTELEVLPGFVEVWYGRLDDEQVEELKSLEFVKNVGEPKGIYVPAE